MVTSHLRSNAHRTSVQNHEEITTAKDSCDWDCNVERGPNWLFVRVRSADVGVPQLPPLFDRLKSLLERNFTKRLVLEFDEVDSPEGQLLGQLEALDQWIRARHGVMRLCGPPGRAANPASRCGLSDHFPTYRDRKEAVFGGCRPGLPRWSASS